MEKMQITSAKFIANMFGDSSSIKATIDGVEYSVPLVEGNRHYDEIMRQVEAGELTIQPAE